MDKLEPFIYVGLQFGLLGLIILLPTMGPLIHDPMILLGRAIELTAILGIILASPVIKSSLTIMPIPTKNARLGTTGLYKYVRHPMYSFVILFALGSSLQSGLLIKYILTLALIILLYYKSCYEETQLNKKFKNYSAYAKKTPRFLPGLKTVS